MSSKFDGLFVKSFKAILNSAGSKESPTQLSNDHYNSQKKYSTANKNQPIETMDDIIIDKSIPINYMRSPPAGRRQTYIVNNNNDDKKRDTKKWSFGGFFRRRKKSVESESSSQDDGSTTKGFILRKKKSKKSNKPKKKLVGTFDHIVIHPKDYYTNHDGIMSDPSAGFNDYIRRDQSLLHNHENIFVSIHKPNGSVETSKSSHESLVKAITPSSHTGSYGSLDSSTKKRHRERARQRRDRIYNNESSSDEGSQRSTTSSLLRIKSDSDSGTKLSRDNSVNRKTRSARTERYIKRLSREDENILNKEAEIVKSKQRPISTSPISRQRVSAVHLPATHVTTSSQQKNPQLYRKPPIFGNGQPSTNENHRTTNSHSDIYGKIVRNGSQTPTDEFPLPLQRTTPDSYYMPKQKSWSFENNINRASPINNNTPDTFSYYTPPNYPTTRPYIINPPAPYISAYSKNPPTPPPRDPQRRVITMSNENFQRPMSYAFENNNQRNGVTNVVTQKNAINNPNMIVDRTSSMRSINSINYPPIINGPHRIIDRRSNSDDHITQIDPSSRIRPASVTPETTVQKRYITRQRNQNDQAKYQFYTDQIPRSRKPIHIVQNDFHNQYLSDSQVDHHRNGYYHNEECKSPGIQSVTQFWKQKEMEEVQRRQENRQPKPKVNKNEYNPFKFSKSESTSSHSSPVGSLIKNGETIETRQNSPKILETAISSPYDSLKRRDSNSFRPLSMVLEKPETDKTNKEPPLPPTRRSSRQNSASSIDMAEWLLNGTDNEEKSKKISESPIPAPRTSIQNKDKVDGVNLEQTVPKTRKSSNLEDALNELEEIYKSLHLGDEDLLDRAERLDVPTFTRKIDCVDEKDGFSSSTESLPSRIKRASRRSGVPDKVTDDMAYRKLRKNDLSPSYSSPKDSILSQVSYLLASPDLTTEPSVDEQSENPFNTKEPDITFDDVVYRNLKHTNNTLKVQEPQPPFGIPVGPVTAAPSSDYLHAKPENRTRSRFIPQKIPDIVKDDLAFRSLRKDQVKDPLLPDDYRNNNNEVSTPNHLDVRKKRAVRSLSANLYNIIQRERYDNQMEKTSSLVNVKETNPSLKSHTEVPTSTETLTGSRNNVASDSELNKNVQHRLRVYIPRGGNQESDTDIEITINKSSPRKVSLQNTPPGTKSPKSTDNTLSELNKSELETLLINLAKETQAESKKLEIELEKFEKKNDSPKINLKESMSDINNVSEHAKLCEKLLECVVESTDIISSRFTSDNEEADDREIEELKKIDTLSNMLTDIDNVSDHAQICEELLECVVESTDLITPKIFAKIDVENTLKVIDNTSNQAQMCEDLLGRAVEDEDVPDKMNIENTLTDIDTISNQAQICEELLECVVKSTELIPIKPETVALSSDLEDSLDDEIIDQNTTPKIATAAIELATNIDNETVELFDKSSELESTIANVILVRKPDSPFELMYIDSDRLSIVKSDDYENLDDLITSPTFSDGNDMDEELSLFETEKQNIVENFTAINKTCTDEDMPKTIIDSVKPPEYNETQTKGTTSSCSFFATCSSSIREQCSSINDDEDTKNSTSLWYNDSKTMALACAYALACTHQLATMDIITILGIVLAVISVLFALMI